MTLSKILGRKSVELAQMAKDPDPSPMPMELPEMEAAKRKVRRRARGKGRASTILAGRMMSERNDTSVLKTRLG